MSYSDDEKRLIDEAYAELHAGDPEPEPRVVDNHDCEVAHLELEKKFVALSTVIEALVIKIGYQDEDIAKVAHTVDVDLIDSARKVAQATAHKMKVGDAMVKYHEKFGPYEEAYKGAEWGEEGAPDIYEQIADIIDEIKMSPDYEEGAEEKDIGDLLLKFKEQFPDVGKPVEAAPEAPKEMSEDEKAKANAVDYVKRFKEGADKAKKGLNKKF